MVRFAPEVLASLLVVLPATSGTQQEEYLVKSYLEGSRTVVLVQVVTSTFHGGDSSRSSPLHAEASVLKAWKGPFPSGTVLHVVPNMVCTGSCGSPFTLQNGEQVLIFTNSTSNPIVLGIAMRDPELKAAMGTLDQAVTEQRELEDPHTDLIRAPERSRVMLVLKKCFADARTHPKGEVLYPACDTIDVSILRGIKRSALVATLGSPTRCQRFNSSGHAEYPSPVGTDCPPEQTPIWSFEHGGTGVSGLWCAPERDLRCMGIGWVAVAGE
jgi:hypothetical protein